MMTTSEFQYLDKLYLIITESDGTERPIEFTDPRETFIAHIRPKDGMGITVPPVPPIPIELPESAGSWKSWFKGAGTGTAITVACAIAFLFCSTYETSHRYLEDGIEYKDIETRRLLTGSLINSAKRSVAIK